MNPFRIFDSMESFHSLRGSRDSEEAEFGNYNQWDLGTERAWRTWDRFRVSVVRDTLDVYATRRWRNPGPGEIVLLLGKTGPGAKRNPYQDADERFQCWGKREPKRLSWFLERVVPLEPQDLE